MSRGYAELDPPPVEQVSFGGLGIAFDRRVLRPRAWTAAQSQWAAELLRDASPGPVLELCSGAGHIGLLAVLDSERHLVCVDVDPVACSYARRNAAAAGLAERVDVRCGDAEEVLAPSERFALVVADPPWVPAGDTGRFPDDPLLAIDGGEDGLRVAQACVRVAAHHLAPGGSALLQLGGADQAEELAPDVVAAGLETAEVRSYPRGAVVRLLRP